VRFGLLTSPLLGPAAWGPVCAELAAIGHEAVVAAHVGAAPASAEEVSAAFVDALRPTDDWVLVPHSNAGLFAPAVARHRRVRAVVYVDARLPASGVHPMSSQESLRFLTELADAHGLLPRWSDWWDDDIGVLFPSEASRRTCESEMRRLPLDYFRDAVDGAGWSKLSSAYLAFGDTYAAERNRASEVGFPTTRINDAEHLHMLIDPTGVAREITQLVTELGEAPHQRR
jgi:hypothetical protein